MELDYMQDMHIDESALDVEWLNQSELALRYGKYLTQCKAKVRKADEQLKTTRSELIMEANNVDAKEIWNKSKPTAGDIEAYYRVHPRYIKAKEEYLELLEESEYAEIAANEVRFTRKAALEHLVTLVMGDYFSAPKVPRNLTKERQKTQEVDEQISKKLNRN